MESIEKQVNDILHGTHTKTSADVGNFITSVEAEVKRLGEELDADKRAMRDIRVTGKKLDEIKQRVAATGLHYDRLEGAVPQLREYQQKLVLVERDERQKAEYDHILKRRTAVRKTINECLDMMPGLARALHEAISLQEQAKKFNFKPVPGKPIHPNDVLVSEYERIPPIVSDEILKGTRIVTHNGTVLYSHVSNAPTSLGVHHISPTSFAPRTPDEEELLRAQEAQDGAKRRLRDITQLAATRGSSVEQVAASQGIADAALKHLRDTANGVGVREVQDRQVKAREKELIQKRDQAQAAVREAQERLARGNPPEPSYD